MNSPMSGFRSPADNLIWTPHLAKLCGFESHHASVVPLAFCFDHFTHIY